MDKFIRKTKIEDTKEYIKQALVIVKEQMSQPNDTLHEYPELSLKSVEVPVQFIEAVDGLLNHYEQMQITIPKSIVDYDKKMSWYRNPDNKDWRDSKPTEQDRINFWNWRGEGDNERIFQTYLANEAYDLGLVKVVDK